MDLFVKNKDKALSKTTSVVSFLIEIDPQYSFYMLLFYNCDCGISYARTNTGIV